MTIKRYDADDVSLMREYVDADDHAAEVARLSALVPRWVDCKQRMPEENPEYESDQVRAAQPQPAPIPRAGADVQSLVIADVMARREAGIAKYGTPLHANNGRDALMDAYQEALDLACYLRQAIAERDGGR